MNRILSLGLPLVMLAICSTGCTNAVHDSMEDYSALSMVRDREVAPLTESLFPGDQAVLSNEAIAEILDRPAYIPDDARVAVLRFGQMPYWWGWSDEFLRVSESIDSDFLGRLRESDRLSRVSYLPSLVTPRHMTVPYLREAAVRFQSDLLLVYRTTTGTYTNRRTFAADEVRAYCTVEGILLDVRTGTVPFSSIVTEQFEARKQSGDKNFQETVAKATQQAMGRAWLRLADDTVAFLDEAPSPPPQGGGLPSTRPLQ